MTETSFETITSCFSQDILKSSLQNGQGVIWIRAQDIGDVLFRLKTQFGFHALLDIVSVDWLDKNEQRFELIYLLCNFANQHRLNVRVFLDSQNPQINTVSHVYPSADWQERECFDMMGIDFKNHPNLKRLLMWNTFIGHPLRKDYALNHRQPIPVQEDIV